MKLIVKKVYCRYCQKLVKGLEQAVNGDVRVSCPRCQKPLWIWDGLTWKHLKET